MVKLRKEITMPLILVCKATWLWNLIAVTRQIFEKLIKSLKEARINVESSLKDQVLRTYFSKKVNSHYVSVKKSRIMPQHSTYLARTSTENSKKSKSMTSWKSSIWTDIRDLTNLIRKDVIRVHLKSRSRVFIICKSNRIWINWMMKLIKLSTMNRVRGGVSLRMNGI